MIIRHDDHFGLSYITGPDLAEINKLAIQEIEKLKPQGFTEFEVTRAVTSFFVTRKDADGNPVIEKTERSPNVFDLAVQNDLTFCHCVYIAYRKPKRPWWRFWR